MRIQTMGDRCLGLDLMRAVAILMVLISHWTGHWSYWFRTDLFAATMDRIGDIGVEIFFALSGFLIGRILIDIATRQPDWRDFRVFMIRRAMRTLPLYFFWLLLLLCVFPPHQDVLATALRFATLTQNLISGMPPDYYFAVTWSLSVEEWFYLLFGALLVCTVRRMGFVRAMPLCLATFMAVPLLLRAVTAQRGATVFWRIDEIAYGVLMAQLYLGQHRLFRHPWLLFVTGIGLIVASLTAVLPVAASLSIPLSPNAEVIGSALCLPAALRLSAARRWIEWPVRWIASRSYALYLIHLTILYDVVEVRLFEPGLLSATACVIIAVTVPFLLAELSYHALEMPILRRRPPQIRADVASAHYRARMLSVASPAQ